MVNRTLKRNLALLGVVVLVAAGCGNGETIPKHSADEQAAIDKVKAMTPQQQIDMIEKAPEPQAAKDAAIKKIKEQNHMQ